MPNLDARRRVGQAIPELESTGNPLIWVGDGQLLQLAHPVFWGTTATELLQAPSVGSGTPSAEPLADKRLAARLVGALRPWENQGNLEIRYVWDGRTGVGSLRVLLVARALGKSRESARAWSQQLLATAISLFPATYQFGELRASLPQDLDTWVELEREEEERAVGPFVNTSLVSYWYLVHPMGGDGSAWAELPRLLLRSETSGFVSVLLTPTVLTELERGALDHVCSVAGHYAAPQQERDVFGVPRTEPADHAATEVLASWRRFTGSRGVLARLGVAASGGDAARMAASVAAIVTQGRDTLSDFGQGVGYKLIDDITPTDAWASAALGFILPRSRHKVWKRENEAPWSLERLPYFFGETEAAGLFLLPLFDKETIQGLGAQRP